MMVTELWYNSSATLHSLALAQLHTVKNSLKSGHSTHFNCEFSRLQSGDKDSQLKQVPHPLFSEFLLQVIVHVRATLHLVVLYGKNTNHCIIHIYESFCFTAIPDKLLKGMT